MERDREKRLLIVIVSMLLWVYSIGVGILAIQAILALPENINPHVVRYLLQFAFIIGGTLDAIISVCAKVWNYTNKD